MVEGFRLCRTPLSNHRVWQRCMVLPLSCKLRPITVLFAEDAPISQCPAEKIVAGCNQGRHLPAVVHAYVDIYGVLGKLRAMRFVDIEEVNVLNARDWAHHRANDDERLRVLISADLLRKVKHPPLGLRAWPRRKGSERGWRLALPRVNVATGFSAQETPRPLQRTLRF